MSLEDRIAAASDSREGSGQAPGPVVPRQSRDAYDAYAEVHALVRDIYERAAAPR